MLCKQCKGKCERIGWLAGLNLYHCQACGLTFHKPRQAHRSLLFYLYSPPADRRAGYVVGTFKILNGFETRVWHEGERGYRSARGRALRDLRAHRRDTCLLHSTRGGTR